MFWSGSLGWVGLYCLFWLVYWAQRQPMDHNTNVKMPNLYNHHLPPLWSPIHFVKSHRRVKFLNPYQRRTHKRLWKISWIQFWLLREWNDALSGIVGTNSCSCKPHILKAGCSHQNTVYHIIIIPNLPQFLDFYICTNIYMYLPYYFHIS